MTNYIQALQRAKDDANDFLPVFPENPTIENLESYIQDCDSVDPYRVAFESSDSWDVVVYTHKARAFVNDCPASVVAQAQQSIEESGFETSDLSDLTTRYAAAIVFDLVYSATLEAIENAKDKALDAMEGLDQ